RSGSRSGMGAGRRSGCCSPGCRPAARRRAAPRAAAGADCAEIHRGAAHRLSRSGPFPSPGPCSRRAESPMPIVYRVDHGARVVVAAGYGIFSDGDVFGYQRDVWSRKDVEGYNELVDMTRVEKIALPSVDRVKDLATLAATMDAPHAKSRMAVVAPDDLAFGLGRVFQAHRDLDRRSTKEVGIFRTMEEALGFL